jgi:polysaccharide biosynthesis transport protein
MLPQEFDYKQYLRLILGRKRLFALIALAVMTLAVLYSYSLPKIYEAKSTVFIEQSVISELVRGIAITPSMDAKVRVLTVAITSRSMLLQVIHDLDMDLTIRSEAERERLIKALQERTRISLDQRRGLFVVTHKDKDPRLARDFVNTLVRRYIEQSTSSRRDESFEATVFLSEQIATFRERIDQAEENIIAFRQEKGIVLATDDSTLRREIERAEQVLADLRARRNDLQAQLNLFIQSDPLRERLASLQKHLDHLLASYTEQHPEVIRTRGEIETVQFRMTERPPESIQNISDPLRFEQIQVELNALDRQQVNVERQLQRNREMLREIPIARATLNELTAEKEKQRQIHQQLVGRYGQSEVSKQMELQDRSASFRIIDPAIIPITHISPNRVMIILFGITGGLGGAFGLLFLLDLLNRSVRSVKDIKSFGLPILAMIPRYQDKGDLRKKKWRDLRFFTFAGAYFGIILFFLAVEFMGFGFVDRFVDEMQIPVHISGLKDTVIGLIK